MKLLKSIGLVAAILLVPLFTSCEEETNNPPVDNPAKGEITIQFDHNFDGNAFAFNTPYQNGSSEDLEFTMVKYYITNVKFEKMDGTIWAEDNSYHLVDVSNSSSTEIKITDVPAGDYHKLTYMIGVDSTRNVSGAQEGALDPANEMFWSWNSGYIFFKLEGNSTISTDGKFMYHVGGFAGTNKAITTKVVDLHNQMPTVGANASPKVHMMVNLKNAFDGMHTVSIASMPKVHMPGMMAVHLAHNFNGAFTFDHIHE